MNECKTTQSSKVMIVDAPGINGNNPIRFASYREAGGPILHPLNPSDEHREAVRQAVEASTN